MYQKMSLKRTDFQSVVSQSFRVLRREEDFYDVTLVSDDETQIPAHKLVLAASSSFFKSILKRNSHSHPLLYLSGVDSKSLGFVMDFIYEGEVQICQDDVDIFLEVAKKLKIEGLLSTETSSSFKFNKMIKGTAERSETAAREEAVESDKLLSAHVKVQDLVEERSGRHYCLACHYSSTDREHLEEHLDYHVQGLSYSCKHCGKTFRLRNTLRKHTNTQHRSEPSV